MTNFKEQLQNIKNQENNYKKEFKTSPEFFERVLSSLKEETKRSEEIFIKHFKDRYKTTDLPIWSAVEVISFGTLSKLYSILKTQEQKEVISKLKGINNNVFKNWLHCLSVIRNVCAHHSRIWNKTFGEDEIEFKYKIKTLLHKYPNVKIDRMGFIDDWKLNSIWKE